MRKGLVNSKFRLISVILSVVLLSSCAVKTASSDQITKATAKPTAVTAAPVIMTAPTPSAEPTPQPTQEAVTTPPTAAPAQPAAKPVGTTYILNTNTKKFHIPTCSSVNKIKDKNKLEFTGTMDDVIAQGYEPCKRCIEY